MDIHVSSGMPIHGEMLMETSERIPMNHHVRLGTDVFLSLLTAALLFAATVSAEEGSGNLFSRQWRHVSESSGVLYWQAGDIDNEAYSYVEYGTGGSMNLRTPRTKHPRWAQFHRLTGLKPGTSYSCRLVNIDPESGEEARSDVITFETPVMRDSIRILHDVDGPPYILDRPGGYYLLTEDVRADGSAFEIAADNVTLDLDGHTVVFGDDTAERVYGVRFATGDDCRLVNGRIVQGGRSNTYSAAVASLDRPRKTEVAGISTDVHLPCAYPVLFTHATLTEIHHNDIYSRVTELESRHYPGNTLIRFYVYGGDVRIHDNILTEGCHWGINVKEKSRTVANVAIDHNDIRHHQQYVNGYAISPCSNADVHHNRITSTGRGIHLTGEGILCHDNWINTRGHQHLSDLPAGTRPFHHRLIELHGIKLEGRNTKHCKIYGNTVRITQLLPVDSGGQGSPLDKMENGVYIRSTATIITCDGLTDDSASWETDRWKGYRAAFSPDHPPVMIEGNDATTLFGDFPEQVKPGEYSIYMKWEYVPPTPLNIACYDPNAMNEVYGNSFTGTTLYTKTRHGGYGDTGQWATGIMFISMKYGPAEPGNYAAYIHDNTFMSNDLFLNGAPEVNMDVRIENNTFILLDEPHTVERESRLRGVGDRLIGHVMESGNTFRDE